MSLKGLYTFQSANSWRAGDLHLPEEIEALSCGHSRLLRAAYRKDEVSADDAGRARHRWSIHMEINMYLSRGLCRVERRGTSMCCYFVRYRKHEWIVSLPWLSTWSKSETVASSILLNDSPITLIMKGINLMIV